MRSNVRDRGQIEPFFPSFFFPARDLRFFEFELITKGGTVPDGVLQRRSLDLLIYSPRAASRARFRKP